MDASVVHMVVMKKPAHEAPKPEVQPKVEAPPSQPAETATQSSPASTRSVRPVAF